MGDGDGSTLRRMKYFNQRGSKSQIAISGFLREKVNGVNKDKNYIFWIPIAGSMCVCGGKGKGKCRNI